MDLLRNYPEFREDIEIEFHDLMSEFNLKLISPFEGCYLLIGEKCKIKFTYDRGDVSCNFLQILDLPYDRGYNIPLVYRYLYPDDQHNNGIEERVFVVKTEIKNLSSLVNNKLKRVLNGDFTWLEGFNKEMGQEDKLSLFVLFQLDVNNPIRRKFRNGDYTWRNELVEYLKKNNISL